MLFLSLSHSSLEWLLSKSVNHVLKVSDIETRSPVRAVIVMRARITVWSQRGYLVSSSVCTPFPCATRNAVRVCGPRQPFAWPPFGRPMGVQHSQEPKQPLQLLRTPNGESVDPLPLPTPLRVVKVISVESFRLMHWIRRARPDCGGRDGVEYPHQQGRGLCTKTRWQIGRRLRLTKPLLPRVEDWLDHSNAETGLLLR
jgi:hypothetical protein